MDWWNEPHACTAAARRDGELLSGDSAELRNWDTLDAACWQPHAHCWAQHPLAKPCQASQLSCVTLCPMPPPALQLGSPAQCLIQSYWGNLDEQPCCVIFDCFWSDPRQRSAPSPCCWPMRSRWRWPHGPCHGEELPANNLCGLHTRLWREGSPVLAWRLAMWPWASLLKPLIRPAISWSSRVPPGGLWAWTLHSLLQSISVSRGIWQLTTSSSAIWKGNYMTSVSAGAVPVCTGFWA